MISLYRSLVLFPISHATRDASLMISSLIQLGAAVGTSNHTAHGTHSEWSWVSWVSWVFPTFCPADLLHFLWFLRELLTGELELFHRYWGFECFSQKTFMFVVDYSWFQNWYVPSQHQQNHSEYLKHLISMSDKQSLKYEICISMFVCHRHHYTKSCDDILLQLYVPTASTPSPNLLSWISCSSINNWALFNPSYICSMVRPSIDVNANRWQLSTN